MNRINSILNHDLRLISFVLLFIVSISQLSASHILGSEITYSHIDGNRYKFLLHVYRDCNECKINGSGGGVNSNNCNEVPPLLIRGAIGTNYSNDQFGNIDLSRIMIKDVTPLCSKEISRCQNNMNVSFGFEVHVFEGVYDFGNLLAQNYCQFDISISMSSRSAKINNNLTEQNFFNFAYLNLCNPLPNSSISYQNPPSFLNVLNQTNYKSQGVFKTDNDSLSFKLRPALANRMNSVIYQSGRSANMPLNIYCQNAQTNCSANINSSPTEGFYLSQITGDLIYTPTISNQAGVVVVECEEWKKNLSGVYYLAGITRRDFYTENIVVNNNLPKVKPSIDIVSVCENDFKSFDIEVIDLPISGFNPDTINLVLTSDLPGIRLLKKPIVTAPFFLYSIEINHNFGLNGEKILTLNAMDNHCSLNGVSSVSVVVNFLKSRKFEAAILNTICNEVAFGSNTQLSENFKWKLLDENQIKIAESYGKRFVTKVAGNENYFLEVFKQANSEYCELNYKDTFFIEEIEYPSILLSNDFTVCKNEKIGLTPKQFIATPDFKFYINNNLVKEWPHEVIVNNTQDFVFKIVQTNGCVATSTQKVSTLPTLNYNLSPIEVCINSFNPKINLPFPLVAPINLLSSISIRSFDESISPIDKTEFGWDLYLKDFKPIQSSIIYNFVDSNSCEYIDTIKVTVLDTPFISTSIIEPICLNQLPTKLPILENETWTSLNSNYNINNQGYLDIIGDFTPLKVKISLDEKCKSSIVKDLPILDTSEIISELPHEFSVCENKNSVVLKALPIGGKWFGEDVVNDELFIANNGKESCFAKYQYINDNNCKSTYIQRIKIDKLPNYTIQSSKDSICYGDVLKIIANADGFYQGYWYTDGKGRFDNPNQLETDYFPSIEDIKIGFVDFSYTIQSNSSCGNISYSKKVFIKDGPKGTISFTSSNNQCETSEFVFNSTFTNVDKQSWFVNDSLVDVFDYVFPLKINLNSGQYLVKTTVSDGSCSAIAFSNKFEVFPKPTIKFISNPSVKLSKEMPRLFLKDQTYCKYGFNLKWMFNDSFISSEREFSFLPNTNVDSFKIKLIATSLKGDCLDSLSRSYRYISNSQLFIPDAFSPDSKGPDDNNVFKIVGPIMKKFHLEIYNKYGEKVYISNSQNDFWDGTYKRQICMPGVYFYKIVTTDLEGIDRDYSGTVTLIR